MAGKKGRLQCWQEGKGGGSTGREVRRIRREGREEDQQGGKRGGSAGNGVGPAGKGPGSTGKGVGLIGLGRRWQKGKEGGPQGRKGGFWQGREEFRRKSKRLPWLSEVIKLLPACKNKKHQKKEKKRPLCSKRLPWPLPVLSLSSAVVDLLPACKNKKTPGKGKRREHCTAKQLPQRIPPLLSLSAVIELLPACKNKKHQEKAKGETVEQQNVAMANTSGVIVVGSH